ncbi:hypothetical protein E6O75_ATG10343 [Venturia nashicola]|uniref:Uncharacterized protein n=1 Tax=Venturia nashicola TaxID=86259 RepID=A0A4Z1NS23_9PEZI|nr:hypothetical protein E6O75_ATG10343 [Venturia nashicola]
MSSTTPFTQPTIDFLSISPDFPRPTQSMQFTKISSLSRNDAFHSMGGSFSRNPRMSQGCVRRVGYSTYKAGKASRWVWRRLSKLMREFGRYGCNTTNSSTLVSAACTSVAASGAEGRGTLAFFKRLETRVIANLG